MIETWFTSECYVCAKTFTRYRSQINVKNPCCSHHCSHRKIIVSKKKESLDRTRITGIHQIKLTLNQYAIVDKDDHNILLEYNWQSHPSRTNKSFYAVRNDGENETGARLKVSMHRQIMGYPPGMDVDHINGNTLDNRRKNLRICTHSDNIKNQESRGGKSSYRGVTQQTDGRWRARITNNYKRISLGIFDTEEQAYEAVKKAQEKYYGRNLVY